MSTTNAVLFLSVALFRSAFLWLVLATFVETTRYGMMFMWAVIMAFLWTISDLMVRQMKVGPDE